MLTLAQASAMVLERFTLRWHTIWMEILVRR